MLAAISSPIRCNAGAMRASAASVIRDSGPDTETASIAGESGIAAAKQRTPTSCSPSSTAAANHFEMGEQRIGDCRRRQDGHPGPSQDCPGCRGGELGEQGVADRGAVRTDPSAGLGEHPHLVRAGSLGDVDDLVAVEHRQVRGLAGQLDELDEVGPKPCSEQAAGRLASRMSREPSV